MKNIALITICLLCSIVLHAQVALKFLIQNGIVIIPKTTHKERMMENINIFDFILTDDDLQEIRLLDTGRNVTGWPSDALRYEV